MDISFNSFFIFIFILFFSFSFVASNPSNSPFKTTYNRLCNDMVPASSTPFDAQTIPDIAESLYFHFDSFSGGHPLFNTSADSNLSKHISFHVTSARRTVSNDVYELLGKLNLQQRTRVQSIPGRPLRPRVSRMRVSLKGFWSESSGKLCMFGRGSYGSIYNLRNVNAVIKVHYPNHVTGLDSLIGGTGEIFYEINSTC